MTERRSSPVRALPLLAVTVCLCLAASCDTGAATTSASTTSGPESTTPTTSVPTLEPVDGSLRVRVPASDPEPTRPDDTPDAPEEVLVVGDSVAILVADELAAMLDAALYVDGVDCRELGDTLAGGCGGVPDGTPVASGIDAIGDALAALADDGVMPDVAVLVLADNSSITATELDAAMAAAAGIAEVWWVNARIDGFGRQDTNNALLDELAARDPRAGVVDWFEASRDRPWLADHVHPNEVGQTAYARLVARHVECGCVP